MLRHDLAFTDPGAGEFANLVAKIAATKAGDSFEFSESTVLQKLDLPAIDQLPDKDFVELRLQSEDFEEVRSVLRRALVKTQEDADLGRGWQRSFERNLDEIRDQARIMKGKVKDKSAHPFMKSKAQGYVVSALSTAIISTIVGLNSGSLDVKELAIKSGLSVPMSTFLVMLLNLRQSPKREERMLRYYNVLLDDPK